MPAHTFLHLSDLHRSVREPVSNDVLIASLLSDRDRYVLESPGVPVPDSIIVSGDIVQGAPVGAEDWANEINKQYDAAYELLAELAARLWDGDRARVAVLPGNHDICWNTAFSAMRELASDEEPPDLRDALSQVGTPYRWSWKKRKVFRIDNHDQYRRRLDAYWNFVERFYRGVSLPFALDRSRGFNIFEAARGKIAIAAFESIDGNDCFAELGNIASGLIAKCSLAIRDAGKGYLLCIAAWHHGVQGAPGAADFMDVRTVHEMIGNGFRLGIHGHQHAAGAAAHYIHLPEEHALALVSGGSLCAGSRELPRGTNRQYNLIVIDDDFRGARVHAREMGEGSHFGRCRRGPFAFDGSLNLAWEAPAPMLDTDPREVRNREVVLAAEASLRAGDPGTAKAQLATVENKPGSYGRTLLLEAARLAGDWKLIAGTLSVPNNADELVLLTQALHETGDDASANAALETYAGALALAPHVRRELEEQIQLRELLRR